MPDMVSIDLLKALLSKYQTSPEPKKTEEDQAFLAVTTTGSASSSDRLAWLESWLAQNNVPVVGEKKPWHGGWIRVMNPCPWNSEHTNSSAFVGVMANGAIFAGCHHNSCADKGWHELRDIYEPGWRVKGDDLKPLEAVNNPHRLSRILLETEFSHPDGWTLRFHRGQWHVFDKGAYRVLPHEDIEPRVTDLIKREFDRESVEAQKKGDEKRRIARPVTPVTVNNVLLALRSQVILPSHLEMPFWIKAVRPWEPLDVLAARNGLFHLPSLLQGIDDHIPHTPLFFSSNTLDYEILLDASPPNLWLQFLNQIWREDVQCIETLQEFAGYFLTLDTSQQKILALIGPKRSGKGVIARVIKGVIGPNNVAGPMLSSLANQFGLEPLLAKSLTIFPDARLEGKSANIAEILLAISGEDTVSVPRKFLSAQHVKLTTRLMIHSNELPQVKDASGALVSRMIVLPTRVSFYGKEDPSLTDKLLKERAEILIWALVGLKRLRERGHFIQPESAKELVDQWENLCSPVMAFVKECCDFRVFGEVERWN